MTHEDIENIESELRFKIFLLRIGLHSSAEYYSLFGEDWEKREIAVKRYLATREAEKNLFNN